MATNLRAFYAHAEAGNVDEADRARDAFMKDHPTASNVHKALFALVLGVLAAGVWSATGPHRTDDRRPTDGATA